MATPQSHVQSTSSFRQLKIERPNRIVPPENDTLTRYFFCAGDTPGVGSEEFPCGGLFVQSPCVPSRRILRCEVTPCVTIPVDMPIHGIPEGLVLPNSIRMDRDGYETVASMLCHAGPEATQLLTDYGHPMDPSKQWGLVELAPKFLRGAPTDYVESLQITWIFFPEWPLLPETNAEIESHIRKIAAMIERNEHPGFIWDQPDVESLRARDIYLQSAKDMLRSVEQADFWMTAICQRANIGVTLPHTDANFKRTFDDLDELCFRRTGLTKATEALKALADRTSAQGGGLTASQFEEVLSKVTVPQGAGLSAEQLQQIVQGAVAAAIAATQSVPTTVPSSNDGQKKGGK